MRKRDGAWSGNAMDNFSKVASGNKRRANRSTRVRTTVEIAAISTHQPMTRSVPDGREMTRLSTTAVTTDAMTGTEPATTRTIAAATDRLRQRPSGVGLEPAAAACGGTGVRQR